MTEIVAPERSMKSMDVGFKMALLKDIISALTPDFFNSFFLKGI